MTIEERIRKLGIQHSFPRDPAYERARSQRVALVLNAAGGMITPERACEIVDRTMDFLERG